MSVLKRLDSKRENQNQNLLNAVTNGDLYAVKLLIELGADVNAIHSDYLYDQCTYLYRAIENGYLEMSQILIEAGADVNAPVHMLSLRLDPDKTSINYPLGAVTYNWKRSVDLIKLLLRSGANVCSKKNWNPLFNICRLKRNQNSEYNEVLFECCKELIKAGAEVNYTSHYGDETPLFLASTNGHFKIVQLLISHGATLDLASAFILEKYEYIESLCDNNTTSINNVGKLLCKAVEGNNHELVTKIINYGINLNITVPSNSSGDLKRCPLSSAREYEMLKLLLENGADPNYILDGDKYSSILCSRSKDSIEVLELLLSYKANPNQQYNDYNINTLQSAVGSSLPYQKAKLLLDAGADINAQDKNGLSALHSMCECLYYPEFNESAFSSLLEMAKTLELLLEYNANPNIKDNKGNTPLHLAAYNNYCKTLLKKLIKAGGHIYAQNHFGETTLDLAIQAGHIEYRKMNNKEAINFLLSMNAECNVLTDLLYKDIYDFLKELDNIKDIEIKDSSYNTLLHNAIKRDSFIIVKKLISKGIQINCANAYMQTALDLAITQKNEILIEYLKLQGAKRFNELSYSQYIYHWLPKNSGTVAINYNISGYDNRIIEVSSTNGLFSIPGKPLNDFKRKILVEVFDYISSIFRIKFKQTEDISATDLFIGQIDNYKNNQYDIKRCILGTKIIRSSLIFDLNSNIETSINHLFLIFLQSITNILGLMDYIPTQSSVLAPTTDFKQKISYSKVDLFFLSSRYKFNKELLKQQSLLPKHNNNPIELILLAVEQHNLKKLVQFISLIDNIDFKDINGNSLIKLTAIAGFIEGTEFLYKNGAKLDLASALVLRKLDEVTAITNQQDVLENYKQLDQLMLMATLRENIPLLKALINYGIQIDDDIFFLSIEIQNLDIIKMFILAGANTMAINHESEGILTIASKLNYPCKTIKFLQESINNNKSKIPSNIRDFKTSRTINL